MTAGALVLRELSSNGDSRHQPRVTGASSSA
jgi:hypothetical protein